MKKCPKCGKELDVDDKRCPHCGIYLFPKRLFRSSGDSKIFGVCGGIGEYFNVDPNIIRVIAALIILGTGIFPCIIVYIILAMIIPASDFTDKTE